MENEKPILTPEQIERLSEAFRQIRKAVKAMTEAIAVWWEQEIAPQMVIVLESAGVEVNDYSSLAETLQKLSELAIDVDEYTERLLSVSTGLRTSRGSKSCCWIRGNESIIAGITVRMIIMTLFS